MDASEISVIMKPNKPDSYEGRLCFLFVNMWLNKVEKYLAIVKLSNNGVPIMDGTKIMYASTFLTGMAAVW